MSQENNEQYKDFMWQKINFYVDLGKITDDEIADLDFEALVELVRKIEEGGEE